MFDKLVSITEFLWGTPLMILMVGVGLYLTIGTGFFQIRKFGTVLKKTIGEVFKKDSDSSDRHLTVKYNASTGKWEERWSDDDDDDKGYRYSRSLGVDDVSLRSESVSFECDVSGASVYVDGHYLGKTSKGDNDFYFSNDDDDSYTLSIEKSGYDNYRDRYSRGTRYGRN